MTVVPDELRAYFHDSWLTLQSYSAEEKELRIEIEKKIGPDNWNHL